MLMQPFPIAIDHYSAAKDVPEADHSATQETTIADQEQAPPLTQEKDNYQT